jgi:uncharacterized membrane protein
MNTEKTDTTIAWFGALCFFLSTIEYAIPKPLPFLRLGIANLPVMLALDFFPFPAYCTLVLIKILGQGLIGGTIFSYIFLFSAAGSISSAVVMLALRRIFGNRVSFIGISVSGAFASNAAQLLLARWYIFGESAWYIAPLFFTVGAISGTILGIFANHYARNSRWYADVRSGILPNQEETEASMKITKKRVFWLTPAFRANAGSALILLLMFSDRLAVQAGIMTLAIALVLFDKSTTNPVPAITMSVSIVLFNLIVPFGRVLWSPFGLPVTEGALVYGIKKALTIEGMIFISRWMLKPGLRLPGKTGRLISRSFDILRRLSGNRKKLDPKNLIPSIDAIMYGRG